MGMSFAAFLVPSDWGNNFHNHNQLLGRITRNAVSIFSDLSTQSNIVIKVNLDEIFSIDEILLNDSSNQKQQLWYRVGDIGYAPSSYIQPVKRENQVSTALIPEEGRLGEVSVPFVDAFEKIRSSFRTYRFYYASTFWIMERIYDDWGVPWYRVMDDRYFRSYFVRAYAIRLVNDSEFLPISPDVDPEKKWIEVNLFEQKLWAYENGQEVFNARISSGTVNSEGYYYTPFGQFRTSRKRPCRHMASPASEYFSGFDLPGVPWVSYITGDGIAFHGAYWHNNFGFPMSHGCINMAPQAAKWIYLWTLPHVPSNVNLYEDPVATRVKIY